MYEKCIDKCDNITIHHIIAQETNANIKKCPYNQAEIKESFHRFIHSAKGYWINKRLQLDFQNLMELLFCKREFSFKEIQNTLEITEVCTKRLLKKAQKNRNGDYDRDEVIRVIMINPFSEEDAKKIILRSDMYYE